MKFFSLFCATALLALSIGVSRAAEVEVEDVVGGLNNPCGMAIQPGSGDLFVADSGAGRVIRVDDGKVVDVITDFPKDVYGKGPMYDIGPLGLVFLDKDTLVVGGGGNIDDGEMLRVYKVPAKGESIKASEMTKSFKLPASEELKAEGNYYGVAATADAIFVTCNGDDTKGWVAKATFGGQTVKDFRRSIPTKEETEVDAPVAVTISPRGQVVIGQMGEITVPEDGLITFYNAKSGKMIANYEVGLSDITGLAYSAKKKNWLYATDFAWHDTTQGGLFRLGKSGKGDDAVIEAKKIVSLDKPTALAFAEDGTLYITVIGTGDENPGKLVKIKPGL